MSPTLLLVSLGPVQDFIASARRCQDLWFGSWMLSALSRAAASAIEAVAGTDALIFPSALGNDKASVANKILAVLPAGTDPSAAAQAGKKEMRARLDELAKEAFQKIPPEHFERKVAEAQVADMMEYFWVSVPLVGDDAYPEARLEAEALLASRKNTKNWVQVPWSRKVGIPKSSIDGLRESVLGEALYDDVRRGRRTADDLRRRYHVKKSERLCGVGLLKRVGADEDSHEGRPLFHSTSHVTAAPMLVRIARRGEAGMLALRKYLDALEARGVDLHRFRIRSGGRRESAVANPIGDEHIEVPRTLLQQGDSGFDGYLLFEDRLPDVFEQYSDKPFSKEIVAAARRSLRELIDFLGGGAPTPYYAVLQADGDHMGRAIEGLALIERHRKLSEALDRFADGCRDTIEAHAGSLIYSGGDDVLAVLPLHTALACAAKLSTDFRSSLAKVFADGKAPTLSVGLGVAHHMEDMGEARELASSAEKLAKTSRNSLAIVVQKRSGGALAVAGQWSEPDPLHKRLDEWCKLLDAGQLPDGVAFELESEIGRLEALGPEDRKTSAGMDREMVVAVAKRIVGRKRQEGGREPIEKEMRDTLEKRFTAHGDASSAFAEVRRLSAEIQVARLFLSAYQDAWGKVPS
jgi:CRISPR-associated protein Cmr2